MRLRKIYICVILFLISPVISYGGQQPADSTSGRSNIKEIKRYIRPCIYLNNYHTPEKELLKRQVRSYTFKQSNVGFYAPLYTNTWYRKDGVTLSTLHLLTVGNFAMASPGFSGFRKRLEFYKLSLGLRTIYSTGKKSVWFFDMSPFLAEDNIPNTISNNKATWRYSSTIIYNRTVSKNFSYRIGFTKTYLFGEGFNLPIIGCRFGPLDGVHVSFFIPRNITLDFPMGKKFWGSIFVKPVGGRYNFFIPDTSFNRIGYTVQFGHREFLTGFLLDFRPNRNISMTFSTGLATKRYVALAEDINADGKGYEPFFTAIVKPCFFTSIGASIRFGQAKKVNNNYEMYDVLDINNMFDPGDNNMGPTNGNIPNDPNRVKVNNIQYQDIKDLIEETDLN
ncbi:MAG: hypothetical protein HYU69_13225 [Bacteroidetes bacterium]|nr:hypothetical protein [Bacteroidota bacterium]